MATAEKSCAACKDWIPAEDRFCMHCGAEQVVKPEEVVPGAAASPVVAAAAAVVDVSSVQAEEHKPCIACKEHVPVEDRFCMFCGTEQVAEPEVVPSQTQAEAAPTSQAVQPAANQPKESLIAAASVEQSLQLDQSAQEATQQATTTEPQAVAVSIAEESHSASPESASRPDLEVERPCVACAKRIGADDIFCKHCGTAQRAELVAQESETTAIELRAVKPEIESAQADAVDAVLFDAQIEITPINTEAPEDDAVRESSGLSVPTSSSVEPSVVKLEENRECVSCPAFLPAYARYCLLCGSSQQTDGGGFELPKNQEPIAEHESVKPVGAVPAAPEDAAVPPMAKPSEPIPSSDTVGESYAAVEEPVAEEKKNGQPDAAFPASESAQKFEPANGSSQPKPTTPERQEKPESISVWTLMPEFQMRLEAVNETNKRLREQIPKIQNRKRT